MEAYEGNDPLYYNSETGEIYTKDEDSIIGSIDVEANENGKVYPYRFIDIKNADAGANFVKDPYYKIDDTIFEIRSPWVIPWYNINGKSYDTVRSSDKLVNVLANDKELTFTAPKNVEDKIIYWIRLIMPKYKRRVEIEDLDRNFWVIGQVLTALNNYLFGDKGYYEMIKLLVDQLARLWENILYLWGGAAILSQKPVYNQTVTKIVVLPNNIFQPYMKYDDFGETVKNIEEKVKEEEVKEEEKEEETEEEEVEGQETEEGEKDENANRLMDKDNKLTENGKKLVKKLLTPYIEQYSNYNLCLFPLIRLNNYDKNYYSAEYYPGAFIYDRNKDNPDWNIEEFPILINLGPTIAAAPPTDSDTSTGDSAAQQADSETSDNGGGTTEDNNNKQEDSNNDIKSNLLFIRKNNHSYYYTTIKSDSITFEVDDENIEDYKGRYYQLLKTRPSNIVLTNNGLTTTSGITHPSVQTFEITLYDAAFEAIKKDTGKTGHRIIGTYKYTGTKSEEANENGEYTITGKVEFTKSNNIVVMDNKIFKIEDISQGFYQGELISYYQDITNVANKSVTNSEGGEKK